MSLHPYAGRRALVTGGYGLIGAAITRALCAAGAEVSVVDSLDPDFGGNTFNLAGVESQITTHIADIRDASVMRELLHGQDFVFNLAGQTGHVASMREPLRDFDINARAQLAILDAARAVAPGVRIVLASTRQLYGRPRYLPVDEAHPVAPVDVNGVSKLAAEQFHLLYTRVYGLATTVLRLTNVYGPGMRIKDARQTFVGCWIRAAVQGEPFEVWGGAQERDLLYVDDVADAFLRAGASPETIGDIFNVGGGEVVTLGQLADVLVELVPGASYRVCELPAERQKIDIGGFHTDGTKLERCIGWRPTTTIREGLRRAVEYYARHLDRYLDTTAAAAAGPA